MKKIIFLGMIVVAMVSCSHKHVYTVSSTSSNTQSEITQVEMPTPKTIGGKPVAFIPSATAFRMSGDYADNVAVTLNAKGDLSYFPAPSDITADSRPIELGDGWWLNRQGLGSNSVFTKYSFAEYASLPQVPSPQQLKADIIPGAYVTDFIELPMSINEANQNIEKVKAYIKSL